MANAILNHPVTAPALRALAHQDDDTYTMDELLAILEQEQPVLMDSERLEGLINGTDPHGPAAELRAYLVGIHDAMLAFRSVRPDLFPRLTS